MEDETLASKFHQVPLGEKARIPIADVQKIETALEAEYMPFYFHDLRTNEIISFHAFFEGLTDSYAPKYQTTSGYGRVDDIMIYEKTQRKLAVSFYIAAMDQASFDEMWLAINRFTMMVYPQWSGGTRVSDVAGNKFIMPFSQIPTASPMVRMRVGNIFRSNYSEVNLGRMMGIGRGEEDFVYDAGELGDTAEAQAIQQEAEDITARVQQAQAESDSMMLMSGAPMGADTGYAVGERMEIPTGHYAQYDIDAWIFPYDGTEMHVHEPLRYGEVVKTIKKKRIYYYVVKPVEDDLDNSKNLLEAGGLNEGFGVLVPVTKPCAPYGKWLTEAATANVTGGLAALGGPKVVELKDIAATAAFLDNAVVRSFQSTAGRGIAGFITSLSFDWNQGTWDTALGNKAPMWCKCSINFSPIHDLPPGLDQDGFMRAPQYPVGNIMGQLGSDPHATNIATGPAAIPGASGEGMLSGQSPQAIRGVNAEIDAKSIATFNPKNYEGGDVDK
jgi:hypothetical protein